MEVGDVVRLKQLEPENLQMQRIIARQTLKIDAMDELIKKKTVGATAATRGGENTAGGRFESARNLFDRSGQLCPRAWCTSLAHAALPDSAVDHR
jgi:hypothetical protein